MVFLLLLFTAVFLVCSLFAVLSYAKASISLGSVRIGIRHLTLVNLAAKASLYDLDCTISRVRIQLYFPTPSEPRWCQLNVDGYSYKDPKNYVTSSLTTVTFWFFPSFLSSETPCNPSGRVKRGNTDGSLMTVELQDFRVLVYSSVAMPMWIDRLRRNVMFAMFNGSHIRADDFETHINSAINSSSSPTEPHLKGTVSEARITVHAKEWHVYNSLDDRLYCFGAVDAQVRRVWDRDEGSLVLIAKDCTWVHSPKDVKIRRLPIFKHFLRSFMSLPIEIRNVFNTPWSTIDVHITRADISYDHFRLRDAEFTYQVGSLLGSAWDDVKGTGFIVDTISSAVNLVGEKRKERREDFET